MQGKNFYRQKRRGLESHKIKADCKTDSGGINFLMTVTIKNATSCRSDLLFPASMRAFSLKNKKPPSD